MKYLCLALFLFSFFFSRGCFANTEFRNLPRFIKSANGRFAAELTPTASYRDEGSGRVYQIDPGGRKSLLYNLDWYAKSLWLSNDGQFIVRFGRWASDCDSLSDLAIAFYKSGTELAGYTVRDLILDPESIVRSASHYWWGAKQHSVASGFSHDNKLYTLVMADKSVYDFDVRSGEILKQYRDPEARNESESWEEKQNRLREKGQLLASRSRAFWAFSRHFFVSDVRAVGGLIHGVYFTDTDQWEAKLAPKKPLRLPCHAFVVFPVYDDTLKIGLSPQDILGAMKGVCEIPFIEQLISKKPGSQITLAMAGDRLHWNTKKASDYMCQVQAHRTTTTALSRWSRIGFDLDSTISTCIDEGFPSRTVSFYHPLASDICVVDRWLFNNSYWCEQYREITGSDPKRVRWFPHDKYVAVVNLQGELSLFSKRKSCSAAKESTNSSR